MSGNQSLFDRLSTTALRLAYKLDVEGETGIPLTGSVIFHIDGDELLSGAALKAVAPRQVDFIVSGASNEVFIGKTQILAGDITLDGFGFHASQAALRVLRQGGAVAFVGEHPPLGYLVASSKATVVPVTITGAGGRVRTDPPKPGSRISIVFEAPIEIDVQGDPCALATVQEVAEQVRQARADAQA